MYMVQNNVFKNPSDIIKKRRGLSNLFYRNEYAWKELEYCAVFCDQKDTEVKLISYSRMEENSRRENLWFLAERCLVEEDDEDAWATRASGL